MPEKRTLFPFSLETGAGIGGVFDGDWSAVGCIDPCNLPNSGQKENALINLVNTVPTCPWRLITSGGTIQGLSLELWNLD
jgi:hypothetical protein